MSRLRGSFLSSLPSRIWTRYEFFKSECADQEGEVCVPLLIKFIPGRIVVKKDGYTPPPVAVPSVAVPYADVHMRAEREQCEIHIR